MSVIAGIKRKLPLGDWAVQPSHRTWLMCESINHHRHFLHAELSTNQWIVRLPSWTTDQESNQSVLKLLVRTTSYCSVVKPWSVKKNMRCACSLQLLLILLVTAYVRCQNNKMYIHKKTTNNSENRTAKGHCKNKVSSEIPLFLQRL